MNKVYILTDMEGISGIVVREQITPGAAEYERARHLLAGDVNAAVAGCFDAGCTEVVVNDGHDGGFNFPIEAMDPRADYVIGSGRIDSSFGLDGSFDAILLVGFHARAGTPAAIWDHTQSWDTWIRYSINGQELGEIGQEAAIAGHYGVPVAFVSGDRAATEEARALFGDAVEVVAVKDGHTRTSARCIHPQRAQAMIRAGVARALGRPREHYRPFVLTPPLDLTLETATSDHADRLERNGCVRVDGHTVRKTVSSALEILNF
jgi:D-amino peptidase